jgi:hypothetical protein
LSRLQEVNQLKKQLNNVLVAYREVEYQLQQYKEIVSAIHTLDDEDHEYWAWQPDEENHLESLTCPVLIPAEWLRNLIDESYMKGMLESYKLKEDFTH